MAGRLAVITLIGLAAACAAPATGGPTGAPDGVPGQSASASGALPRSVGLPTLVSALIEPGAGMAPIYALLASARHTLDLTMYELEDTRAEQVLASDAARGVDVRVLINSTYTGSANGAAFSYLQGHGVRVRWASALYALTHQKTLIVDGAVSVIMTLNWTSRYYLSTRDVAVVDRRRADIEAIEKTFDADYGGTPVNPPTGVNLVWSPSTSLPVLMSVIDGAKRELDVENEEMSDASVTSALAAAAQRGVNVQICTTDSSRWSSAFSELERAGARVRVFSPEAALYIHAKVIVRDPGASDAVAFVGSQNFSAESLTYNRELGILLDSRVLIGQLSAMIRGDADSAAPWAG
jgi:phosphatidylserine/phosphatidylglycerophosphate/cardiolipin synthase-like enzyme